MNDRELLERAAKAAGIVVIRSRLQDPLNKDMLVEFSARNKGQIAGPWNPLSDDGDAFRLAVRLNLGIQFDAMPDGPIVSACWPLGEIEVGDFEWLNKDPLAATRRAIVRAAAALADSQPFPSAKEIRENWT